MNQEPYEVAKLREILDMLRSARDKVDDVLALAKRGNPIEGFEDVAYVEGYMAETSRLVGEACDNVENLLVTAQGKDEEAE